MPSSQTAGDAPAGGSSHGTPAVGSAAGLGRPGSPLRSASIEDTPQATCPPSAPRASQAPVRARAGSARFLRLPLGRQGDPAWRLGGGAAGALQAGVPKRLARRALAIAASLALAATALVGPLPAALAEGDQAPQPVASSIAQPRYLLAASVGGGRAGPVLSADVALSPVAPEAQAPEGDPVGAPASPEEAQGEGAASPALPALSAVTASFSVDGCTYAIEPDGATVALVAVDPSLEGGLALPSTIADADGAPYDVARIAAGAFAGSGISSLLVAPTVAAIEPGAFAGAKALDWLDVADGSGSFASWSGRLYDSSLTTLLHVPPKATDLAMAEGATSVAAGALAGCGELVLIQAPATIVDVSPDLFEAEGLEPDAPDPSQVAVEAPEGATAPWEAAGLTVGEGSQDVEPGNRMGEGGDGPVGAGGEGNLPSASLASQAASYAAEGLTLRANPNGGKIRWFPYGESEKTCNHDEHSANHEGTASKDFPVAGNSITTYFDTGEVLSNNSLHIAHKASGAKTACSLSFTGWQRTAWEGLKPGHSFRGWNTDKTASKGTALHFTDDTAHKIFAIWKINTYSLTWKPKGGTWGDNTTTPKTTQHTYASTTSGPSSTPPRKSGYEFKGWAEEGSGNAGKLNITVGVGDTIYEAVWSAKKSDLTFDLQGGTGTKPTGLKAAYGSKAPPYGYAKPVKAGHKFLGFFDTETTGGKQWYTDGGESATGVPAPVSTTWNKDTTSGTTLYARWSANTYAITLMANHSASDESVEGTLYYKYGESSLYTDAACKTKATSSNIPLTRWEGRAFDGYKTARNGGTLRINSSKTPTNITTTLLTGDTTWYANWHTKQSSLTFDANGGTWPSGGAPSGVEATYGSAMPTTGVRSPNPPAGYAFAGYYDGTGANAKKYYTASSANFVTSACAWDKDTEESTTLYARWTKTVKLDKQGGSGGTDSVTYTRGIGFSSGVTKPMTAPSGGWTFLGYCDYDPSNSPGSNVYQFFDATGARTGRTYDSVGNTIYAWWVKQVTLNRYAAAAVDGKVTKLWALKGAPLGYACSTTASTESAIRDKFPSAGIAGTTGWAPTFDTWTFAGYYNSGTGSTCYLTSSGGRSAKCPDNMPATIYAKWKRVVTLHYENGTTGDASKTTVDACFNNPMPSVSKPAFSGWTFAGYWSKTKGEGDRYYNDNGSSAMTFSSSYGATNLYAKWVRTITLDPNGGNAQGSVSSIELVSGQELPSKLPDGWEAPTNRGMCFAGYYEPYRSDIERYSFRGELLTGVNDLGLQNTPAVFKAKWQPIYEITLDKRGGSGGLDRFYVGYNTGFFADAQCTKELSWPIMLPSPPDGFDRPYIRGFAYLDGVNASGHATGNGVINSDGSLSGTVTSTTFSKDTRLYATYTPKNITVTWSLRGAADSSAAKHGSWTSSLSDNADKAKTRPYDGNALGSLVPSAPMRAGYQFVGWSTEPSPDGKSTYEGVNFITSDNALPTSDTTYYARWREIIHVGWHTNGGDWDEGGYYYRSTDSLWGDPVSPISNKVNRTGYAFLGWSTDQSATQPDQQYVQTVTGPLTYYAVWKANDYALTLDANGGSWAQGVADPPTIQATYDSVLPTEGVPVPTWTGRKFLGYNDRADGTGKAYYGANEGGTAVADPKRWDKVTPGALYAQWQVIEYPITYTCSLCEEEADGTVRICPHMDTSSLPASFTVLDLEEGSSVWVGKPEMSPGYGFDFWRAFDPGSEGSEEGASIWEVGPKRFEAKAYLKQYTVHLDAAGGAFADGSQSTHLTYTIESDAIQLERPRWGGHTFAGWVDEDGEPFGGTIAAGSTGDRSYTATWSLEYYPIEYDLGGGRFPNVMVPYGYSYDSPDVPLVAPIRDGYRFTGWLDADNQDADPVIDLVIPTHSWGEKRFIATWEAVRYLIRFDLGLTDAAWEPDDQGATPPNPMEAAYDQPIAMPRAPKRAGYIFKGWGQLGVVTTPGGSQETVVRRVFEPGKEYKVNLAQDEGATVTLTGLWERNLAASVPVEIDLRLFANYGTGQFEVGPESEGSDIGTFENRSSGELKVTGLGEVTDDGAFAQERRDARLEAFGTAANLAQVQLTLQPLDGEGEPTGAQAQLPLGGSTTLSEVPDDQGISYAPGWMMPPGGRLVVGYGLDTGSLQVHEMKRDLHKPMAKLSYTLALVNP